jgi:hypothetical protein
MEFKDLEQSVYKMAKYFGLHVKLINLDKEDYKKEHKKEHKEENEEKENRFSRLFESEEHKKEKHTKEEEEKIDIREKYEEFSSDDHMIFIDSLLQDSDREKMTDLTVDSSLFESESLSLPPSPKRKEDCPESEKFSKIKDELQQLDNMESYKMETDKLKSDHTQLTKLLNHVQDQMEAKLKPGLNSTIEPMGNTTLSRQVDEIMNE